MCNIGFSSLKRPTGIRRRAWKHPLAPVVISDHYHQPARCSLLLGRPFVCAEEIVFHSRGTADSYEWRDGLPQSAILVTNTNFTPLLANTLIPSPKRTAPLALESIYWEKQKQNERKINLPFLPPMQQWWKRGCLILESTLKPTARRGFLNTLLCSTVLEQIVPWFQPPGHI